MSIPVLMDEGAIRYPVNLTAQRLADLMAEQGVSQSKLARAVGITQGAISKILQGQTAKSRHIYDIAAALGVTAHYLLGWVDDPQTEAQMMVARPMRLRMDVLFPTRPAIEMAILGVLRASRGMSEDELALELSKRLPTILQIAEQATMYDSSHYDERYRESEPSPGNDGPPKQRASRR